MPIISSYFLCVILFVTRTLSNNDVSTYDVTELRLLGLLPMTGRKWSGGGACLPAVHLAMEDINARSDILPGYNLTYEYVDTQCSPGVAVYRMFEALFRSPPYSMVLGPVLSTAGQSTAQVTHLWNLTQISPGCTSPVLSDRSRFPTFYRMGSPDQKYVMARIDMMKLFGWQKIATIHKAVEFFSVVVDDFTHMLNEHNLTVTSQEIYLNDPRKNIHNLKKNDARIIFTGMYEDDARVLLCEAYKIGLYGPKVVWIFAGWYSTSFWKFGDLNDVTCTSDEMETAVEGAFLFHSVYTNPVEERGIAGITASEFFSRFYAHRLYNPQTASYDDNIASRCYDIMWLAALALNCTQTWLVTTGHEKTLGEFSYDVDINDVTVECMKHVSSLGVSGPLSFIDGDPDRIVKVERIQGGQRELVAYYRQDKRPQYFEWIEGALKWNDGRIPRDSTYVSIKEVIIPPTLYVVMCGLSALGIALALAFLVFNIVYRENRIVKLSSPNINNMLLLGCIIAYMTVFFKTTENSNGEVCRVRVFCFSIGFTITFGSLFTKTWRVYRIFTNKKMRRVSIKDVQLLGLVGALVSVVLLVLVVWQLIAPHRMVVYYLEKETYVVGNDVEVRPFVRLCRSELSAYFNWTLYVLEGTLLAFSAFLAWETRQVKIEALNDSHQIGLCVYNVVILSAVGLTLFLLLDEQVVMLYGVTSGCLIIGTTLTQFIVFIPKVRAVYHGRTSGKVGPTAGVHQTTVSGTQHSSVPWTHHTSALGSQRSRTPQLSTIVLSKDSK